MPQQSSTGLRSPRVRLAADIAFTLAASSGLGWWTIWFAITRNSWEGWATGGGTLLLIALGLLLSVPITGKDLDRIDVLAVIATVISEFGLGWLTVSFATDHYAWPTWLFISLAYAVLLLAFGLLASSPRYLASTRRYADSALNRGLAFVLAVAPAATAGGVAGRLAVRGHPGLAWIPVVLAIGYVTLLSLYVIASTLEYRSLRRMGRPFAAVGSPPGATASLATQLVGIVLPAGAVAWAAERATHGVTMASMAADVAVTCIAIAILLAAQSLILSSVLHVEFPRAEQERLARAIWAEADQYQALVRSFDDPFEPAPSSRRPDPSLQGFVDEHTERRTSFLPGDLSAGVRLDVHMAQRQIFMRRARSAEQREKIDRWDSAWRDADDIARVGSRRSPRPLVPATAVRVASSTLVATGIVIDAAWPRIELILPPGVRREIRRAEGYLALLRVLGAGALCAAITWPVAAGLAHAAPGVIALLVIAPLLIAAVVVWQARRRVANAYRRRADAISVYRTELVRAMRLKLPRDSHELRALGRILSSDELADGSSLALASSVEEPQGDAADLTGLRQSLAEDVSRRVLGDVRNLLDARDEQLIGRLDTVGLTPENLSDLSAKVSATVSDRVDQRLGRQIQDATMKAYLNLEDVLRRQQRDLQRELRRDLEAQVRESVRASVEASVSGPPLANFVGYVAIELDRRNGASDSIRGGKGRLIAPAGTPVGLIMSVVRDPRALAVPPTVGSQADKPFYAFEPFDIQGGRDEPVAEFHALVESPTLTPLPHRKDLRVENEAQAAFAVKLPDEAGTHEVWFQLYQAGRLVQVTAVRVEAQAEGSSTVSE